MTGRIVDYADVRSAAAAAFGRDGTLDVEELARALSISRATLYRVIRSRDRLIGDVLWEHGERSLRRALREAPGCGIDRAVAAGRRHLEEVVSWQAFLRFVHEESVNARRVLFSSEGGAVHPRYVELWAELLADMQAGGELRLPYPPADAAQLVVSVTEAVVYKALFIGQQPDLDLVEAAQRALLRGP